MDPAYDALEIRAISESRFWLSADCLVHSPLATAEVNRAHRLENISPICTTHASRARAGQIALDDSHQMK